MSREVESFQRFIFGTIDSLVQNLEGLTEAELNWRPAAPDTNSLYAIVAHVLGNAEEVMRSRPAELAARGSTGDGRSPHADGSNGSSDNASASRGDGS
jgi:Protein of unknown function (DUF664)